MGIDLRTAVRLFITQMVKAHRLPFKPASLPIETLDALHESEHHDDYQPYDSAEAMWSDLHV